MHRNEIYHNSLGISISKHSDPVVGGSLAGANRIYENPGGGVKNTALQKKYELRTMRPATLRLPYNYWGADCPDSSDFRFVRGLPREVPMPGSVSRDDPGLPLLRPPYGRITAIDMSRGEHLWMVPNGDGPRSHPLLEGLDVGPMGVGGRAAPLVTGTLLFLGEGSDAVLGARRTGWGKSFRAYDKGTGEVVWQTTLDGGTTGAPMTYMHGGRQYIVVPIGSSDHPAEWVALRLSR